jgi:hypothetical protein
MTSIEDVDWISPIRYAKNEATHRPWGEIDEEDAYEIIAQAAKLKGVNPPETDSDEYRLLVEEVVRQGDLERDELKQGRIQIGDKL